MTLPIVRDDLLVRHKTPPRFASHDNAPFERRFSKRSNAVIIVGQARLSVIVVAVVNTGVTPEPHTMFGVIVPLHKIAVAPPPVLPVLKFVAVPAPPVPAGNVMLETGEQLAGPVPEIVQPPVVRATDARA
jgi:hypothetical protein